MTAQEFLGKLNDYFPAMTWEELYKQITDNRPAVNSDYNTDVSPAKIKAIWFKNGQNSVLRKNKSGCCCIIDDNANIISTCGAHEEWLKKHLE